MAHRTSYIVALNSNSTGLVNDAFILSNILTNCEGTTGVWTFTGFDKSIKNYLKFFLLYFKQKFLKLKITTIHIESVHDKLLNFSDFNMFIPNQECFDNNTEQKLSECNEIWVKTHYAQKIFLASPFHEKVRYIGFTSKDRLNTSFTKDYTQCLHIAGKSKMKGTDSLLKVWLQHPEFPVLNLVTRNEKHKSVVANNINIISRFLSEHEIDELQNTCAIHLCPSEAEGFGHYICEALGCGAIVLTTNAPPMNELVTEMEGVLVDFTHTSKKGYNASLFYVSEDDLSKKIAHTLGQARNQLVIKQKNSREKFLSTQITLEHNITNHLQVKPNDCNSSPKLNPLIK